MKQTLPRLTPEQAEALKQQGAEAMAALAQANASNAAPTSTPTQTQTVTQSPAETQPQSADASAETPTEQDTPQSHKSLVDQYLESIPEFERRLYMQIRDELLKDDKMARLLVSGQLTYTFNFKSMPIVFKLLSGKEKYLADQYQYGADPLNIFQEEIEAGVKERIEKFAETPQEAHENYLKAQSIDSVGKRAILVTLGMSIVTFNTKKLGDIKNAVETIQTFQSPLIQKLHQVFSVFDTVVTHILNDEDFLKN